MVQWSSVMRANEVFSNLIGKEKLLEVSKKGYAWFYKEPSPYRTRLKFKIGRPFIREIKNLNIEEKVKALSCPIYVVQGGSDNIVPPQQSKELFQLLQEPKALKIIEDANHFYETKDQQEQLFEETVKWFSRWLQ